MSKIRLNEMNEDPAMSFDPELSRSVSERLFLQSVVGALNVGRLVEATRRFDDGLDRGLGPHDTNLLLWLVRDVGVDATARLIDAYAQLPCFACRHGVTPCEVCGGLGRLSMGTVCRPCIGIGCVRCTVCNGSGTSAATHVPRDLYLPVMVRRLDDAIDDLRCLLEYRMPEASSADSRAVRGDCCRMLLECHRLMGVFENVWRLATQVDRFLSGDPKLASRAARASRRYAARAHARMWRIVDVVAQLAEHECLDATTHDPSCAGQPVTFYRSLLTKPASCRGTILDRRILMPLRKDSPGKLPARAFCTTERLNCAILLNKR